MDMPVELPGRTASTMPASSGHGAILAPELAIIVPTLNERANIDRLVERLRTVLAPFRWEVIFVDDDSVDGTREEIRRLGVGDSRIRCLHRIGRRGLSSACIEGIQATFAPFIAVMDADLQHDEHLLPRMLACLRTEPFDMVVGSRYVEGGQAKSLSKNREAISNVATWLGRKILRIDIKDPMSGFFMVRREAFEACVRHLSGFSFKILADLLASSPRPLRLTELPYAFRPRASGESKLDIAAVGEYVMLLADKLVGKVVPLRFLLFATVGATGIVTHVGVLWLGLAMFDMAFGVAQAVATFAAMIGNFFLNNIFTYHDRRLRKWEFLKGLLSFCAVCSVGAIANVGVASYMFSTHYAVWWLAGLAGAAMSSVWNYAVSSFLTWK